MGGLAAEGIRRIEEKHDPKKYDPKKQYDVTEIEKRYDRFLKDLKLYDPKKYDPAIAAFQKGSDLDPTNCEWEKEIDRTTAMKKRVEARAEPLKTRVETWVAEARSRLS